MGLEPGSSYIPQSLFHKSEASNALICVMLFLKNMQDTIFLKKYENM